MVLERRLELRAELLFSLLDAKQLSLDLLLLGERRVDDLLCLHLGVPQHRRALGVGLVDYVFRGALGGDHCVVERLLHVLVAPHLLISRFQLLAEFDVLLEEPLQLVRHLIEKLVDLLYGVAA